jgi:two-component sensor histidine kinase
MFKLLMRVFLLLPTVIHAQSISTREAKAMTNILANSKPDSVQMEILLKLAKYHVFKPGENKDDLDSAVSFIKKAENINARLISNRANGYISLIKSYWLKESGQRDKARDAAGHAVALLKNEADKNLAGEAYMELSGYLDYNDSEALTQRCDLVKLAVNCYGQAGNIQQKAASLQMLGDLYNIKGSSYIALQYLQASLDAYKSINYPQVQGIYCLMGFIYTRLREYRRALDKQLLALRTAEATGDSSMQLCQIYNYLGELQNGLAEKEKAIYYYNKALGVARKHNDIFAIYIATVNIANTWTALNNPAKALELMRDISSRYEKPKNNNLDYNIARCYIGSYCLLKQFEKARPYANQLLHMINVLKMSDNANISAYTVVIRFFISAGEYGEARKYLENHEGLAKKLNDYYYLAANQKLRFMLDTSRHDYKAAIIHSLESNRLNDSLSMETKSRQIKELEVQFETEKKENTIAAKNKDIQLLKKQSQLQESMIEKNRLLRNFMIAAAGLLLLILALVYRGYIIKKKNNRVLSEQRAQINDQNIALQTMVREQEKLIREKEWLLKEIHHRVKNNLQTVMSLLNSQTAFIDNQPALTAIHDSQHRVHAMALIHQKLYGSANVSSIDMSIYIRELVSYLADSFDAGQRICFELDTKPIEMDVSQAVPLGLILNEAITNSIKYAFPDGRNGVISISLSNTSADQYLLSISDNGIGIPANFKKAGSLGMSLIRGLSEDLDGSVSIENNNGTIIKVSFVQEISVKKPGTLTASLVSDN